MGDGGKKRQEQGKRLECGKEKGKKEAVIERSLREEKVSRQERKKMKVETKREGEEGKKILKFESREKKEEEEGVVGRRLLKEKG